MTDDSKKEAKIVESDLTIPAFELETDHKENPQDAPGISLSLSDDSTLEKNITIADEGSLPSLELGLSEEEPPKIEVSDPGELSFNIKSDLSHSSSTASKLLEKMRMGFSAPTEAEAVNANKDDDLLADIASFNETRSGYILPKLETVAANKNTTSSVEDLEFSFSNEEPDNSTKPALTNPIVKIDAAPIVSSGHNNHPEPVTAIAPKPGLEEAFALAFEKGFEKETPQPIKQEEELDFSFAVAGNEEIEMPVPVRPPAKKLESDAPVRLAREEIQTQVHHNSAPVDLRQDVELQATLRQLREEREELLRDIKNSKNMSRELEQDNLTLKAALDEAKIEISILRKRHTTDLDDLKYRLSISEDKKTLAEEKTKSLLGQKDKLEQKVRIDLSQVRQREKELETKLEMLAIDVDAQVQSRDQKILELRRKIDSLEFNMENVSIKEQKTTDDKRKIEDKLNKIMKTLRNSIKNLEEDVDSEILTSRDSTVGKNK
jgi:hypothetical protein